jgi:hypothetical protein
LIRNFQTASLNPSCNAPPKVRQNSPTGNSFLIIGNDVKPANQK